MHQREANAFGRLKERILRPTDRFERVENGLIVGMPDVNYCIVGQEGWMEIKCPQEPARPSTALFGSNHEVSIDQINWMHSQHLAGGVSWLFIGTSSRLMLINGGRVASLGREINKLTVAQLEAQAAWRTPVPVNNLHFWMDLRELLARPPTR